MGCSEAHTSQGNSVTKRLDCYLHLLRAQWTAHKSFVAPHYFEHSLSAGRTITQKEKKYIEDNKLMGVTGEQ